MEAARSPQRPEHTRSKSAFSFRSHKSSGSIDRAKVDLTETESERRKNKFSGKTYTNPNRAVQEAEPSARAQEETTLATFRGSPHKDWQGNPITDPDSSNPARPRLERPLDTIRSFEAAVDGSHARKTANARSESAMSVNRDASRRSSVIGTDININPRSGAAIPGAPLQPARQQYQRDPYAHPYGRGPSGPPSSYPKRGMGQRMQSAPDRPYTPSNGYGNGYNGYNGYPNHGYNDSYDMNGDSSSPSEPWANSTDPSSENSSVDRIHAYKQADGSGDAYGGGYQQYGGAAHGRGSPMRQRQPITEESWDADRGYEGEYDYQGPPYQSGSSYQNDPPSVREHISAPPLPPSHMAPPVQQDFQQPGQQRRPIALGEPSPGSRPSLQAAPSQPNNNPPRKRTLEKRQSEDKKSWFKKRFSRG